MSNEKKNYLKGIGRGKKDGRSNFPSPPQTTYDGGKEESKGKGFQTLQGSRLSGVNLIGVGKSDCKKGSKTSDQMEEPKRTVKGGDGGTWEMEP